MKVDYIVSCLEKTQIVIDGLIYIPFTNNVEEAKVSLAKELQRNGYEIDITKL